MKKLFYTLLITTTFNGFAETISQKILKFFASVCDVHGQDASDIAKVIKGKE